MSSEISYSLSALYRENVTLFELVNALRGVRYNLDEYQLCIDGFPRSANSYAVNLVQKMEPTLNIIHHVHAPAIIKKTAGKIPTIILIREPQEAILSEYIRDQHSNKTPKITQLIKRYIQYYKITQEYLDKITLFTFKQVTETPEQYLKTVSTILDKEPMDYSGIITDTMNESKARVTENIIYTTSVPTTERTEYKEKIGPQILQDYDFSEAEKIFNQLVYA